MNYALKTKTFNALGTPSVNPGQPLDQCLEPGARIVGIFCGINGGAGTSQAAIFASVAGVDNALMNMDCTTLGSNKTWWAGVDATHKDGVILQAGPGADTINGFLPRAMQSKWSEAGNTYDIKLLINTTGFGSVIVFYTIDPPSANGESA